MVEEQRKRSSPDREVRPFLCDVCPRGMQKAVKSCLGCVASYCEAHLQPHYDSPALQRHKLIEVTRRLQETICSLHKEPLKVYCRTDQRCICLLCVMDEHRHHDTISAMAEQAEIQKSLDTAQIESWKSIQKREKLLHDVRQAVESLTHTAQAAVEDNKTIFASLIYFIETRCIAVKELIQDQEKDAVGQAKGLQEKLEWEIAELRRRDAELEKLSHTEDHIHFLQCWKLLCAPPGLCDATCVTLIPRLSFGSVSRATSELKDQLEIVCQREFVKISETVSRVNEVAVLQSQKRKAGAEPIPRECLHLSLPTPSIEHCPVLMLSSQSTDA
ncbi:hypothetical protein AAFF_G00103540 [Aldrovandia affinis]|uniref:B box-type domain-containing protein n=1 Tax=Aldrovandia affinis TaxID=143900 RepID=A0AAD7VWQ3_9TELE|nr:hypothetical protein AAFF_G00103540 [Aldrovandia affinis]